MSNVPAENLKEAAHRLIDALSNDATWDDLMEQVYIRQAVEAGRADADAGRVVDVEQVRRQFGLQP